MRRDHPVRRLRALGALVSALLLCGCREDRSAETAGLTILDAAHVTAPGLARSGDVLTHQFMLRNETARAVEVVELEQSCGCTEAMIDKRMLQPGDFATLEVMLDTIGKAGAVDAQVVMLGRDRRPLGDVSLSAVIEEIPTLYTAPAQVVVDTSSGDRDERAVVRVVLQRQSLWSGAAPRWVGSKSRDGSVAVAEVRGPDLQPGPVSESWSWTASLAMSGTQPVDDVITVTIDDGRETREARSGVRRSGTSWFEADVSAFFMGIQAPGSTWSAQAVVSSLACAPERVHIESSCDWLEARLEADEAAAQHHLRLTAVPPNSARGEVDESVRVTCGALPEVSLSVKGMVR